MKTLKLFLAFSVCLLLASGLLAQNANVSFRSAASTAGPWCPIMGPGAVPLADGSFIGAYLTGPDLAVDPPSSDPAHCGDPTDDDIRATGNQVGSGGLDHLIIHPNEIALVPDGCLYTANGSFYIYPEGFGTEPCVNQNERMYLRAFNSTLPATATHYNDLLTVGGVTQNWYMRSASGSATVVVCFTAAMPLNCQQICNPQEAAGPEGPVTILAGTTHYFFGETEMNHCTLWMTAGTGAIEVTATLLNALPPCPPFENTVYMTRVYDLTGMVDSFFDIYMGYSQADYDATSWASEAETGMHVAYYDGDPSMCDGRWVKVLPPGFPGPAVITDTPEGGYAHFMSNHLSLWSFGWGDIGDTTQLPVELSSFEATPGDHMVRLDWETASERDNHGFYIERSTDGENFVRVSGLIEGHNGETSQNYTYSDSRLNNGVAYSYRLAIEDINGGLTYSNVENATPSFFGAAVVVTEYKLYQNYPNPFNPSTNIAYDVLNAGHVTLTVYNVMGQAVKTLVNENRSMGRYAVSFDATGLSSGIYFYTVKVNNFSDTKKMLLVQ
jgi:hypothetical protein